MPVAFMTELAEKWAARPQFVHESPPHYKQTCLNNYVEPQGTQTAKKNKKSTTSPKKRYKQTFLNKYMKSKGILSNKKQKSTTSLKKRALRNSTAIKLSDPIIIRSDPVPIPMLTMTATFLILHHCQDRFLQLPCNKN